MNEPLVKRVRVRCNIERAFEAFTDQVNIWWPLGHRRLDGARLVLETKIGGRFFERSDAGKEFQLGEILKCDPPMGLSFTWALGAISKPTRVDIDFEQDGEDTIVCVTHSEAESALGEVWPQRVVLFTKGWTSVLDALGKHLVVS